MNYTSYFVDTNHFGNPNELNAQSFIYNPPKEVVKISSRSFDIPKKGTEGSAAYDLRAELSRELYRVVEPGETAILNTGIALELPSHIMALVLPRSGLATHYGITLANSVGLIDPDYSGDIKIAIKNTSQQAFTITHGDRIAQLLIMGYVSPEFVLVKEVFKTTRGDGGFGSTGT